MLDRFDRLLIVLDHLAWSVLQWHGRDPGVPDWFEDRIRVEVQKTARGSVIIGLLFGFLALSVVLLPVAIVFPSANIWIFEGGMVMGLLMMCGALVLMPSLQERVFVASSRRATTAAAKAGVLERLTGHERLLYEDYVRAHGGVEETP